MKTRPTGFSSVPPPGPGDPGDRDRDVGAEPLARTLRHRRRDLGRDGAVRGEQLPPARRAAPPWPRSSRRSRRRGTRRSTPGRRSAGRRRGRRCTTRRSTSVRPRSRSRSSTSSAVPTSRCANRNCSGVGDQLPLDRVRARVRAAVLDEQVDVQLEVPGADRDVDARRRRRRPSRASGRSPTPRRRRSEARAARARCARVEQPAQRLGLEHTRPELLQLARRARAARPRRTSRSRARPPAPCRRGRSTSAPSGSVACFVTPSAKSPYGRFSRAAIRRERSWIASLSGCSTCTPDAGGLREQLDRAVVVRRAEAARDDEQVVREPFGERSLEVGRVVADDRDPRRLEPEARGARRRGTARFGRTGRRGRAPSPMRRSLRAGGMPTGGRDDDHLRPQPGHVHQLAANLDPQVLGRVDRDPELLAADRDGAVARLHRPVELDGAGRASRARAVTWVEPSERLDAEERRRDPCGVSGVFGCVTAPGFLSLVVQAEITITVKTAIAASAKRTTVVSVRRFRRCGRAVERRACARRAS